MRTQFLLQASAKFAQQLVARDMPLGIVDALEPVKVDQQHRALFIFATGLAQPLARLLTEQEPVGKPGERIVEGQLVHAVRALLALHGQHAYRQADVRQLEVQLPGAARLSQVEGQTAQHASIA